MSAIEYLTPPCPKCQSITKVYELQIGLNWRCDACDHDFYTPPSTLKAPSLYFITDRGALDKIAEIEFPFRKYVLKKRDGTPETTEEMQAKVLEAREVWKREQLSENQTGGIRYSWAGALADYQMRQSDMSQEERKRHSSAIHMIYGAGGLHRYAVTIDGRIYFSWHHAQDAGRIAATEAGFPRW